MVMSDKVADVQAKPGTPFQSCNTWLAADKEKEKWGRHNTSSSPHKESLQPTTASEYGASKQNEAKAHIQHLKALKQLWRKCFVVTAPLFVSKQPIIKAD